MDLALLLLAREKQWFLEDFGGVIFAFLAFFIENAINLEGFDSFLAPDTIILEEFDCFSFWPLQNH